MGVPNRIGRLTIYGVEVTSMNSTVDARYLEPHGTQQKSYQ